MHCLILRSVSNISQILAQFVDSECHYSWSHKVSVPDSICCSAHQYQKEHFYLIISSTADPSLFLGVLLLHLMLIITINMPEKNFTFLKDACAKHSKCHIYLILAPLYICDDFSAD